MTTTVWDPSTIPVTLINTDSQLSLLAAAVARADRVAVDTETEKTTSFPAWLHNGIWSALRIVAVAVRYPDGEYESFVVDFRDVSVEALAPVLATIKKADAWNANFDEDVLLLAGCNIGSWRDAMFTDGIFHSGISGFGRYHGLAFAAKKFLHLEMSGKGTTQTSYDATSDLTDEQVRYPGADAVITLRLAEHLDDLSDQQGLPIPVELEQRGRPFVHNMHLRGLPLDMVSYRTEILEPTALEVADAKRELASLTGGAAMDLFGESENPTWNPDSDPEARNALNTWAATAVKEYTGGRLLAKTDPLTKSVLKQIKHPLAAALLRYNTHAKLLSTYGENIDKFVDANGRMHPDYKQGGVTSTGRTTSDKPNAQNLTPLMKAYLRPPVEILPNGFEIIRVFVYADLSQAEVRVLTHICQDGRMLAVFTSGGDFHANTASDMFAVDMNALRELDPGVYVIYRKKSKAVTFGIPYGLGAPSLATQLTVEFGVPTTPDEAAVYLKKHAETYVDVAAWLRERDAYVRNLSLNPGPVDWRRTFELYKLFIAASPLATAFRKKHKRPIDPRDLSVAVLSDADLRAQLGATADEETVQAARLDHMAAIAWALTFDAPVVLLPDGTPWAFESRTLTGRRRILTVGLNSTAKNKFDGVITSAALAVCTSNDPAVAAIRDEFATVNKLVLPQGVHRCKKLPGEADKVYRSRASKLAREERTSCVKTFENKNKPLKYELIKLAYQAMGPDFLSKALGDQVRSMGNRFRNHPIQGLVADVGFQYFADIHQRLTKYRNAFPVQAVHDSIAIECDLADATQIMAEVKEALEGALSFWCPTVPAVADADIRTSLSDKDVLTEDDIARMLKEQDAKNASLT